MATTLGCHPAASTRHPLQTPRMHRPRERPRVAMDAVGQPTSPATKPCLSSPYRMAHARAPRQQHAIWSHPRDGAT